MNIVLLPAHNEQKAIGQTITEIREFTDATIVVADSASTDKTISIASNKKCWFTFGKLGKGRAVTFALRQIASEKYENIVMMDSDFTYPARFLPQMFNALDKYDAVYGHRVKAEGKMFDRNWKWGNQFVSWYSSILYQRRTKDVLTGFWGFRKSTIDKMKLTATHFELEADIFSQLVKAKASVGVVPITYRPRIEGDKPKIHRMDHLKIMWFLLSHRFTK